MIQCIPELMNISFQQWPLLANILPLDSFWRGKGACWSFRIPRLTCLTYIASEFPARVFYLLGWLPPLDICLVGVTGRGQLTKSITNRERGIAAADYNPIPRTKTSGRKKSCLLANLGGGEEGVRVCQLLLILLILLQKLWSQKSESQRIIEAFFNFFCSSSTQNTNR